mgnify:CR=1 FL=1
MTLQKQITFWVVSFLVLILVLWLLSPILLPFIAGLVLAYFLDPVADKLMVATALIMLLYLAPSLPSAPGADPVQLVTRAVLAEHARNTFWGDAHSSS